MDIYGRFSFKEGIFTNVDIHEDVFDKLIETDECGIYTYNGEIVGNQYEFLDDLLDKMETEQFNNHKAEFNLKTGTDTATNFAK